MSRFRINAGLAAVLTALTLLAIVSCSRQGANTAASNILAGKTITIGNWWGDYDVDTAAPSNEIEELQLEWRRKISQERNVTIKEVQISGWDEIVQTFTTSVMAGNPVANVFAMQPNWAMPLYRSGLLFPVSDSKAVDLTTSTSIAYEQIAWNQQIREAFTFSGKTYAFTNAGGGSAGVYFNKRLFREAGLDPDLPYNMQRDGNWTWENFYELCRTLTRDTTNSGRPDAWAMCADWAEDILMQLVFSNGGGYVIKDSSGKFVNGSLRPEFLEAFNFARRMRDEGILMPQPEGAGWNWYEPAFIDGQVAMWMAEEWRATWTINNMTDDWGYVMPPVGPREQTFHIPVRADLLVVPSTFSLEEVDVIMTAVDLWNRPVTTDWKADRWHIYRDTRAIDETLTLMRDPRYQSFNYLTLFSGIRVEDIAHQLWGFEGDPAQLVESVSRSWNSQIDEMN